MGKTFTLVVYYIKREQPQGVRRIRKEQIAASNEKEARLMILKDYVEAGFRVLKIKRGKAKTHG